MSKQDYMPAEGDAAIQHPMARGNHSSRQEHYLSPLDTAYEAPPEYSTVPPYNGNSSGPTNQIPAGERAESSTLSNSPATPTEEEIVAQATKFTHYLPAAPGKCAPLSKPVAIPQTTPGIGQPFTRCYAPILSKSSIDSLSFLQFIDNLNILGTGNPALQALGLTGGALGMVPYHWAQLAGAGVQVAAGLGKAVVSKGRVELYMREMNRDFFRVRGLRCQLVKWGVLVEALGLPEEMASLPQSTEENVGTRVTERKLEAMKPFIAELEFDMPAMAEQSGALAKLSAMQVEKQTKKNEQKAHDKRQKIIKKLDKVERDDEKELRKHEKEMRKLDEDMEKETRKSERKAAKKGGKDADKAVRKLEKEMSKIEEERDKVERELQKKMIEGQHKRQKEMGKDKQGKEEQKLLWILIENI